MVPDRTGRVWVGHADRGVSIYEDGRFSDSLTVAMGLVDGRIRDILQDRAGHMWFATYGGGVTRYDGEVFQPFDDWRPVT
jgi:ligand-binding sensor domain-containing protein